MSIASGRLSKAREAWFSSLEGYWCQALYTTAKAAVDEQWSPFAETWFEHALAVIDGRYREFIRKFYRRRGWELAARRGGGGAC